MAFFFLFCTKFIRSPRRKSIAFSLDKSAKSCYTNLVQIPKAMKGRSSVSDSPKRAADAGIAAAGQAGSSPGAAVRPFFYGRRCRIPSLRDNGCFVRECAFGRSRVVPRVCVLILSLQGSGFFIFCEFHLYKGVRYEKRTAEDL